MLGGAMLWLSLGENCLSDAILKRHGLKSFSTPFSLCRSNVDVVNQATEQSFTGLLDPETVSRVRWGQRKYCGPYYMDRSPEFLKGVIHPH